MWQILILAAIVLQTPAQELLVKMPDGKVKGRTLDTPSGKKFYTWRHIPFAKPPLGELRFQPPVKSDPWKGILDGSNDSKACIFAPLFDGDPVPTNGYSEDCLYINVYSPFKANTELHLPVMFYIYGGAWTEGSGDFLFTDPTPLLEENIIYVSFNYRLGVFGFLSTGDEIVPGNAGLKDQLVALEWTKKNIAYFGGNPNDITIFGNSAGAMAVGCHLVSKRSRNLFTKAIMQSGSALVDSLQQDARKNAVGVASKVNSSINEQSSSEEILKVLQSADVDFLVNITHVATGSDVIFTPTLEPKHDLAILTDPIYELLEAGNGSRIPIILGTTSAEKPLASIEAGQEIGASLDSNPASLLPTHFNIKSKVNTTAVGEEIKYAYVGNGTFKDNLPVLVDWMSDEFIRRPIIKHALLQSKYSPVYYYQFSYEGTLSLSNPVIPGVGRVSHAQDLGYLFNITIRPIKTPSDYLARRRLVKLWTNFAKFNNPTPSNGRSDILQNVTWTSLTEGNFQYLDIGDNLEMKHRFYQRIIPFWDYLWSTYSNRPYNIY